MTKPHHAILPLALLAAAFAPAHAQGDAADAMQIVGDLTTQIGERLAGTPREAAARDWAVARLKALGFAAVHVEAYTMLGWERGAESAEIVTGALPQRLVVTALGDSGATPAQGITAPLVYFPTLAALQAAPAGSLAGRIAFIDHAMRATQDGSGYGVFGQVRRKAPGIAAQKGALAVLIRSVGTDHNRDPHAGVTNWPDGVAPIPAAAVSVPDALLIARRAAAGVDRVHLVLTPRFTGPQASGNVVAQLPGRDHSLAPILVACHLDSWDLATGAIDDGAGCAIVTAAALRATHGGPLLRTIRVLWAGGEERGGFGGKAYAAAHAAEPHAVAMDSDMGADRIWRVTPDIADPALADRIATALWPLGVVRGDKGWPEVGADAGPIQQAQHLASVGLAQDATRYFDIHHTPDDTLDKIDPAALEQCVEVWTATLRILGETGGTISAAASPTK